MTSASPTITMSSSSSFLLRLLPDLERPGPALARPAPTPRTLAALADISSGGGLARPPFMSTECLRELDLLEPWRFSRVGIERDRGGVLAKTLANRAGWSLALGLSVPSEPEPLDGGGISTFSALSADDLFLELGSFSGLDLDGGFGSLSGAAVHVPHDDEPSRLTLGLSFLDKRTAAGVIIGVSGNAGDGGSGTAGGGGGRSIISGEALGRLDFLLLFGVDMSTTWTISSSSWP